MQQFVIPGRLASLNDYIGACRQNPRAGAKLKRDNQNKVISAIREHGLKPMESPVTLYIHWVEPNMRRDKDNVRSGVKYILDALVETGIISGDGWKHVINIHDQYTVDKSNPHIFVLISDNPKPFTVNCKFTTDD